MSIVDHAVAQHIRTFDAEASRYLKFRKDVLQVSVECAEEVQKNGKASSDTLKKLELLQLEHDKLQQTYPLTLSRISRSRELLEKEGGVDTAELQAHLDAFSQQKSHLLREIDDLHNNKRPTIEKTRLMVREFNSALSQGRSKESSLDPESKTFSDADFDEMSHELNELVDVDTAPYLSELVRSNRAFSKRKELHVFNVKNLPGYRNTASTMEDHERQIRHVSGEIKALLQKRGAARARWLANAARLERVAQAYSDQ